MSDRQSRTMLRRMSLTQSASSASTSPERRPDEDDVDSIMLQANDSVSSLAISESSELADSMAREMEELCKLSPICRLPAELMIAIFARLPKSSDLANSMLVSRSWARNCVALLWHRPQTTTWPSLQRVVQTLRHTQTTFDYHYLVKRLNLSSLGNQASDGTLLPFQTCKRIERLTLTNCTKLSDLSIAKMVEGNTSLMALDVTNIFQVTDNTLETVGRNCFRLQGLNITNCKQITNEALESVAYSCRQLKRLKFNGCDQITDKSIIAFARNCRHLLEIDLASCRGLGDDAVTALITEGQNLRELRLASCVRITDHAFLNLPWGVTFESLRILDLTDCNELQDAGVQRIIEAAPRLRNLVLAKCRQITDRAIQAITKLGKNLHYIHLGHCARITDVGVQSLVRLCNRIRYIDLACCTNLTDHSITQLATLPKLKRIGLVKCGNITDISIHALAKPRYNALPPDSPSSSTPSALERVHLSYCTQLTLAGITALLNNCPRLSHLSLTGVQAFLREDLLVFCREAPQDFNEHQREVFCVFSGNGVNRLRYYLNQQADAENHNLAVYVSDDGMDLDRRSPDNSPLQLGSNTDGIPPPPPPPPHRRQSLPIQLNHNTIPGASIFNLPIFRAALPPLLIPTGPSNGPNGTPGQMSPTNDAPLSVDEGEEFNEFPDLEPAPQPPQQGRAAAPPAFLPSVQPNDQH